MTISLPIWKEVTCESCHFRVGIYCRRAISSMGYPKVKDEKGTKFMMACSYWCTEGGATTDGSSLLQRGRSAS